MHRLRIGSLHLGRIIDIMARTPAEVTALEVGFRNEQVSGVEDDGSGTGKAVMFLSGNQRASKT